MGMLKIPSLAGYQSPRIRGCDLRTLAKVWIVMLYFFFFTIQWLILLLSRIYTFAAIHARSLHGFL